MPTMDNNTSEPKFTIVFNPKMIVARHKFKHSSVTEVHIDKVEPTNKKTTIKSKEPAQLNDPLLLFEEK